MADEEDREETLVTTRRQHVMTSSLLSPLSAESDTTWVSQGGEWSVEVEGGESAFEWQGSSGSKRMVTDAAEKDKLTPIFLLLLRFDMVEATEGQQTKKHMMGGGHKP